jgi:hypothetical protein
MTTLQTYYSVLIFIACLVLGCTGNFHQKTAEELKADLKIQEEKIPVLHLQISNIVVTEQKKLIKKGGWFSKDEYGPDGCLLTGEIKSNASIAKYQDVQLRVAYLSQTGSEIKYDLFTIYDFLEPYSIKKFEHHLYPPDDTKNYRVLITEAKASL